MQKEIPVVEISRVALDENYYERDSVTWDAPTLIEYCNRKQYPVFDLPLAGISLKGIPWKVDDMVTFLCHAARINAADLTYPIILDDQGYIADGWHRVASALLQGKTTIKAIRIQEMPAGSGKITTNATNND